MELSGSLSITCRKNQLNQSIETDKQTIHDSTIFKHIQRKHIRKMSELDNDSINKVRVLPKKTLSWELKADPTSTGPAILWAGQANRLG